MSLHILQYVTRMALFDLVEITSLPLNRFFLLHHRSGSFQIRYEKNEVSRIYVIRFMAWNRNKKNRKNPEH